MVSLPDTQCVLAEEILASCAMIPAGGCAVGRGAWWRGRWWRSERAICPTKWYCDPCEQNQHEMV